MNNDATEAALGLLGLSPLNAHPHHHPALAHGPSLTSPSVGIAVDRSSAPPVVHSALPPSLVPLKRKQPSPLPRDALSAKPRLPPHPLATSLTPPLPTLSAKPLPAPSQRPPQHRPFSPILSSFVPPPTPSTSQLPPPSPSTSQHPLSLSDAPPPDSEAISCICGMTYDDGFSIACDDCSRWCHAACFGIVQGEVPEFWKCWVCDPTVEVDKDRAVKIQKGRLKAMRMKATNGGAPGTTPVNGVGAHSAADEGKPASRRKTSPGAERKSRRGSAVAAAIEGSGSSRKKKRAMILSPADPSSPSIPPPNGTSAQPSASGSRVSHPNGNDPTASRNSPPTPMTFPPDTYPNPSVHAQLLRVAKAWRGVTALNPPSPLVHPPPKTFNDGGYTRVDSYGYQDRYGYSMSPLDNSTPVILDENARDIYAPRTVLRTDPTPSCSNLNSGLHPPSSATCTPSHLRPPSPRLHVASDPSPFPHTSTYPSPPISNYMSPTVPSSSHQRLYAKSPLTPSTNTISSSNPNDTIPATTLLAPYTAAIIPSAAYLADPLNGYAHLGMGKPQVKLVGGGWDVGLDTRGVGGVPDSSDLADKGNEDAADGKSKWARCGCWPNAVVRPVICGGTKLGQGNRVQHKAECAKATSNKTVSEGGSPRTRSVPPTMSRKMDDSSDQDDISDSDADSTTLSFALFALRDLRADEEIVLGWEWDDGHAVHMLPALMESPGLFAPAHLHHLRAQFTSILHALSSTFTTCACGSSTRDCAVRVMERVVEGRWPWPGEEMTSEGSEAESSDASEEIDVEGDGVHPNQKWGLGMNVDVNMDKDASIEVDGRTRRVKKRKVRKKNGLEPHVNGTKTVDLGPLVGVKRGFRTREKAPTSGGWGGVEVVPSSLRPFPEVRMEDICVDKGKGKARVADDDDDMVVDPSPSTLPPRMRKTWSRPSGQPEPSQSLPSNGKAESPMSVSVPAEASGRCDGLNGDGEDGADGQETEFDTETEADGSDDTRQMPPPPMPASLDPTTVSSLVHAHAVRSVSPRGSAVAATWIPPRTPTPTSASSTALPHSITPRPPQVNLPPSTPTSPPAQVPIQSHLPVPPSSLASTPSAPFSKLSLHSPDTSTSSHLSVLFSPSDASSSSAPTSNHRHTSPLPHRPSKPLHVHPQNEPPSLPVTLPVPAVTRDTPAEAKYQQSCHSPELPRGALDDKKRVTNDEHRVRFVSPEVLSGLPRLKGTLDTKVNGVHEVNSPDQDRMNVDMDVVDEVGGAVCTEPLEAPPDALLNEPSLESITVDAEPASAMPSQELLPRRHPSPYDPDPDPNELTPEPISVDAEPVPAVVLPRGLSPHSLSCESDPNELTPEPTIVEATREPSPPPPPKVKMSLKDFALRKKKQREEEMAAKAIQSPVSPDGPALPSSPACVDVKRELPGERAGSSDDVKMSIDMNGMEGHVDVVDDSGCMEDDKAEDTKPPEAPPLTVVTKVLDTTPRSFQPPPPSPRASGEKHHTDQTQTHIDSKPPTTLEAKTEMMDAVIPSGLVGADDCTDVVSAAPEPPPPPLTIKQASKSSLMDSIPRTRANTLTPLSTSTSTSTSGVNSRSNSVGVSVSAPNLSAPRKPSHEDGEIPSSTPPKSYLPRSHTPPTQPRSFNAVPTPTPSLASSSTTSARRPAPPLSRSPLSNTPGPTPTPIVPRPLPSGPRALRGSMSQPTHPPTYASSRSYGGSQYIPRGPSADRDRLDWERDRQWSATRTRGRAGSNGWGR